MVVLLGLLALAAWFYREPVADLVIRRYLAANGVAVQARTARVGSDALVFDDVRLGPVAAPDLTASRITIDVGWSRLTPAVRALRLNGTVLRMRADSSGVSFGSLDRLIPPGRSTRFPAIALAAQGAVVRVATPVGELVWRVDGSGRLDRDFHAVAELAPAALHMRDCGGRAVATVTIATHSTGFDAAGNGNVQSIACRGVAASRLEWRATAAGPLSLASLRTTVVATIASARWQELYSGVTTVLATAGGSPGGLSGSWQLHGVDLGHGGDHAAMLTGSGTLAQYNNGVALTGTASATGVTSSTAAALPNMTGWPTLAARLANRLRQAARSFNAEASFVADLGDLPAVRITRVSAATASGLRATLSGKGLYWSAAAVSVDGIFDANGGGLPALHGNVVNHGVESAGGFALAPWQGGGDALAVSGGMFSVSPRRLSLAANVLLSSAVAGGRIDVLRMPLTITADAATGALSIGDGCAPITLGRAEFGSTVAGPLALTLCPVARGPLMQLNDGRLRGDVVLSGLTASGGTGVQVVALAAQPMQLTLRGTPAAPVLATPAATLTATLGTWRGGATVAAKMMRGARGWSGGGSLSAVAATGPALTLRDGSARWQLAAGKASLSGVAATLIDPGATPRFAPLRLSDATAQLDAACVTAHGTVRLASSPPAAAATLATVAGSFDLASRTGRATLDSALTFTPALQPLQISEQARGIVANVAGKVTSHADMVFSATGLTGAGRIRLDQVSLATAALGPVSGIDGTIGFDDLLTLHTPPHQTLHIGAVDPGIAIEDVIATFQLLGPGSVALERLRWPFTGGTMTMRPTVIRAGLARRSFTVDVDGLDAEAFLQRFELKNLSATGRFDGTLPLVFDGATGRIEGGVLSARTTGGLLQYVGDVGQGSMGAAGKLAFDALRKLRYRTLTLRLDGDLDGELVIGIDFTGTNELPIHPVGKLPIRAAGLPFKFGVTVRAPFRALLGTATSFSDARTVIRSASPAP